MKLLSIVIPTYNPETSIFLRCISRIREIYSPDIELIIVDDCSSDKSYLNAVKDLDAIIIENEENLGQGLSRQKGLEAATSRFITFVDQDDEFYGFDVLRRVLFREDIEFYLRTPMLVIDALGHSTKIYDDNTLHGMFFNREVLIENNVHFSSTIRNYEDIYFMAQLGSIAFHKNKRIIDDDEITYTWYLWEGSQSHRKGDGVYLIETYDDFLAMQKEMLTMNMNLYGYDEYLQTRFKLLTVDLYFTSSRYQVLEEKVSAFIKEARDILKITLSDLLTLLEDPWAYADSCILNMQRMGPSIPRYTLKDFVLLTQDDD